jgi:hypothetical protein
MNNGTGSCTALRRRRGVTATNNAIGIEIAALLSRHTQGSGSWQNASSCGIRPPAVTMKPACMNDNVK